MHYRWPHILAASLPCIGSAAVHGWRSALVTATAAGGGFFLGLLLERVGRRGDLLSPVDLSWSGFMLALLLPASLGGPVGLLTVLMAVLLLGIGHWLLGGPTVCRLPLAPAIVIMLGLLHPALLSPSGVAPRGGLFVTDVRDASTVSIPLDDWHRRAVEEPVAYPPTDVALARHTAGEVSREELLRNALPPLPDVVLGATPTVPGGSVLLVIAGLLLLLRTHRADGRIALIATLSAYLTLMLLPHGGNNWRFVGTMTGDVLEGLTVVHYQLLGGTLIVTTALFAATPGIRPLTMPGRIVYALLLGVGSAAGQTYGPMMLGPLVALLAVSAVTPLLDRYAQRRPVL